MIGGLGDWVRREVGGRQKGMCWRDGMVRAMISQSRQKTGEVPLLTEITRQESSQEEL